ncbi:hypothetical protein Tco_0974938 [Tanacetum coccineum]|uniref:Uncharacterized protein n=1 Tax=Tanacetum coccineum TaxID=301880 RepID=A0ABQ5ECZ2_9ASTR
MKSGGKALKGLKNEKEISSHGPSDDMHKPSQPLQSRKDFCSKTHGDASFSIDFSLRVLTMKMEILLKPTSNKLMVGYGSTDDPYDLKVTSTKPGRMDKAIFVHRFNCYCFNAGYLRWLHPSGSGTVTKTAPSAAKIKPSITNEGTDVKSEAESWGKDKDDSNNEHDSRSEGSDQERDSGDDKAQSDNEKGLDSEHETNENESDKAESDDDKGMDYTTNQFDDDKNVRLNEPVDTDKGFIQKEGTDAEMINVQQGIENPKISQVIEDAHVILSTVLQKTEVPVTSSSQSSDLASKFQNFLDIPHTNVEIVSLMDVHGPFTGLTYEMYYGYDHSIMNSTRVSSPLMIKKRKTNKDAEPTKGLKAKESHSGLSKGTKSQSKSSDKSVQSEEPEFEVADSNMPQIKRRTQYNGMIRSQGDRVASNVIGLQTKQNLKNHGF